MGALYDIFVVVCFSFFDNLRVGKGVKSMKLKKEKVGKKKLRSIKLDRLTRNINMKATLNYNFKGK